MAKPKNKDDKVVLKALDEEQRLFLGVVLEPEEYDLHKDIYSAEEIRKACDSESQYLQSNVQHSVQVDTDVMEVTKSFIQEVEAIIGDKVIKEGTWLREAKIHNDDLWEAIKDGEFTGWSIGCTAKCNDVPVDCIKSKDDIKKAKWNPEKFQRLEEFDFSSEGAHIALVDRAANGWEALVIKSAPKEDNKEINTVDLESIEKELLKKLDVESISKQDGDMPMVQMSLSKLLQMVFYAWEDDANAIAESVMKSSDEVVEKLSETLKDNLHGSTDVDLNKHGEKPNMSKEEVIKAADVEAMINKALEAQAAEVESLKEEVSKSKSELEDFRKAEDIRKDAKFNAMAEGYSSLGDIEGLGQVLKSLEGKEGFDKIVGLLDSAVETVSKGALLDETGSDGEGSSLSSFEELEKLAEAKAAEVGCTIQKAFTLVAQERPDLVK